MVGDFNSVSRTLETRGWKVTKKKKMCMCMCVYMSPPGTVTRLPVMGKALHVCGDGGGAVFCLCRISSVVIVLTCVMCHVEVEAEV